MVERMRARIASDMSCNQFICKLTTKIIFWLIQFPRYPYDKTVKRISNADREIPIEDVKELQSISSRNVSERRQIVIILLGLIYAIKNLCVPWIMARRIDFKDLDLDSANQHLIDEGTIQVFCVQTNCTMFVFPDTGQTLDIRHFPLIPICYPALNSICPPTTFIGPYAMFIHSTIACASFIWLVIKPLKQWYSPAECDTVLFLVAPKLAINLMLSCTTEIYKDYKNSFRNYLKKIEEFQKNHQPLSGASITISEQNAVNYLLGVHTRLLQRDQVHLLIDGMRRGSVENTSAATNESGGIINQFARGCLPRVRTMKWHSAAQSKFVQVLIIVLLSIVIQGTVVIYDVSKRIMMSSHEYRSIQRQMYQSGCRTWYSFAPGDIEVLPPTAYTVPMDIYRFVDNCFLCIIVILATCFVALGDTINNELNCWLKEIHNELEILIEISRLQSIEQEDRDASLDHKQSCRLYIGYRGRLESWRDHVGFSRIIYPPKDLYGRGRLNSMVRIQQMALRKLSAEIPHSVFLDKMVKIHVSFRLFMNHISNCSESMTLLSLGAFFSTFTIVPAAVWHSRLIGQLSWEHLSIAFICSVWSTTMLTFMSSFHAKVSLDQSIVNIH